MRDGYEWEVLDPHDAWSYIGYWGDHQVAYLLKLLEVSAHYHPGTLAGLLTRRVFTYANVPYRIRPIARFSKILAHHRLRRRSRSSDPAEGGTMGRTARLCRARRCALSREPDRKLLSWCWPGSSTSSEAGLWMNTQRPEWNDANNALVGPGVSMVTSATCAGSWRFAAPSSPAPARQRLSLFGSRRNFSPRGRSAGTPCELLGGRISDRDRKVVLDSLGNTGSDYRAKVYAHGFSAARPRSAS